ncbi:MAG: Wzz/FepE/Etk N-terminal domain-containing protein [Patescibacteria group bacterium]|jgi:capsular polysaccharide biosynthesis protein
MELRQYIRIIGKHWVIFALTVIILTLGTFFYAKYQPKTYLASTTLTVDKESTIKQSQVDFYLYDNYYNVQSAQLFSQIVDSWFNSPSVINDIYNKAGVPIPNIAQGKLPKLIKALLQQPATINVSLVSANRDDAAKLIDAAAAVMQEKTNDMASTDQDSLYQLVKFNSIVTDNPANTTLDTAIALIVSILLGAVLALSVEYFRQR